MAFIRCLVITDLIDLACGKGKASLANLQALQAFVPPDHLHVMILAGRDAAGAPIDIPNAVTRGTSRRYVVRAWNLLQLNHTFLSSGIIRDIRQMVRQKRITHVFIDDSQYGKLARLIKQIDPDIFVATFFHNVRGVLSWQWLRRFGPKYLPLHISTLHNEKMAARWSDACIALSDRDDEIIRRLYRRPAALTAPLVMHDVFDAAPACHLPEYQHRFVLLFVGSGDYYPNIDGIRWFISAVMPKLPDLDLHLLIVGKHTERYRTEFQNERISVIGGVDRLAPYYHSANAVIAPILEGGGMKVKVAEAYLYGKCVIGTEEGLSGYPAPATVAVRCRDADEFARAIRACRHEGIGKQAIPAARDYFVRDHRLEIYGDLLRDLFERTDGQGNAAPEGRLAHSAP